VRKACAWLEQNGIAHGFSGADRRLRGCLATYSGHGILFFDDDDPEDEQRFTLAHELAHFLRDYSLPRQFASDRLGAGALAVLDRERAATADERLGALLGRVPLSLQLHLMDRQGSWSPGEVAESEWCADRLACELLAPAEHIRAAFLEAPPPSVHDLDKRLREYYGLPAAQAAWYARQLRDSPPASEPWLVALRQSLER
jgi:hypothetical protein